MTGANRWHAFQVFFLSTKKGHLPFREPASNCKPPFLLVASELGYEVCGCHWPFFRFPLFLASLLLSLSDFVRLRNFVLFSLSLLCCIFDRLSFGQRLVVDDLAQHNEVERTGNEEAYENGEFLDVLQRRKNPNHGSKRQSCARKGMEVYSSGGTWKDVWDLVKKSLFNVSFFVQFS